MDEKKMNGYILPDGEYVRLDDLEGMERALSKSCNGETAGVQHGLRQVALELAQEYEDADARRFLARARELGAGDRREVPRALEMGVAFERIERYDLAIECYVHGRSLGKYDELTWYFLHNNHAYCLAMMERFAEAEQLTRAAIAIDPARHNAHKNLGLALMGQERLREAAASFRRAREIFPEDGRAVRYLALVEERLASEPARPLN